MNRVGVGGSGPPDPYAPRAANRLIRNYLEGRIDLIDFLVQAEQIAPEQWVYDVDHPPSPGLSNAPGLVAGFMDL